jgi:phosphatidylglycerophosphatase A
MGATRLVPVFGEHGALLEHGVFTLFFSVPISLRRRWDGWEGRGRALARIGTCGGVGRLPGPAGTYASLLAAALLVGLYHVGCPWWAVFVAVFPVVGLAIGAAGAAEGHFGRRDPRPFVLDEVAGMLMAGLAAWAPAFLAGIARVVQADPVAWSALGRGAWLRHLAGLPGEPWAWASLAVAFVWFRVCDVLKPPPVRQAERLAGGWGVVADDVLAGAMALALTIVTVLLANRFMA